jgi:hypothetical protein
VNAKAFLVDALTSALDLGLATPDDIVRHVTPDVLAAHLPRPLWARLLTACVGAPRVDAQLVVETLGVANLGEHLPLTILWTCLAEVGTRALGGHVPPARVEAERPPVAIGTPSPPVSTVAPAATVAPVRPLAIESPPPPEPPKPTRPAPVNPGPSIPSPTAAAASADSDAEVTPAGASALRGRTPTNRFRPSSTNSVGRLGGARRPQAAAPAPEPAAPAPEPRRIVRRGETEPELEVETAVGDAADWRNVLAVEDEQLVDWAASEETRTGDDDLKR